LPKSKVRRHLRVVAHDRLNGRQPARSPLQIFAFAVCWLVLGCSGINQRGAEEQPWKPVKLAKAHSAAHIKAQLPLLPAGSHQQKIIFIGVQGGNPLPWDDAVYFDPLQWPPYRKVDLKDEAFARRTETSIANREFGSRCWN
jgi:hypothetical protein